MSERERERASERQRERDGEMAEAGIQYSKTIQSLPEWIYVLDRIDGKGGVQVPVNGRALGLSQVPRGVGGGGGCAVG